MSPPDTSQPQHWMNPDDDPRQERAVCETCAEQFDRKPVNLAETANCFICQRLVLGTEAVEISYPDHSDPEWALGSVLAQVEDLEPADRLRVLQDALKQILEWHPDLTAVAIEQQTERFDSDDEWEVDDSDPAFQSIRYQSSPFYMNLSGLVREIREHRKLGAKVADNAVTHRVFYYAEGMADIERGVTEGTLDKWGYPIEDGD